MDENNNEERKFQGRVTLSQIKNGSPNDNMKNAQIYVRVIAMDLETTANNQKFPVVVGDSTAVMKCSVAGRHNTSMHRAFSRDTTLSITDFMVAKDVLYISDCSLVMRCVDTISISPEMRQQGSLMLEKPNTVAKIKASPLKTRVSLKGKIVKVKPMQPVKIRRSGEEKPLISAKIKDKTGTIPISLWGKTATQLQNLKVGDCVSIERAERGVFNSKATLNTWEDSTTIEMIPDDMEITSSDDEDPIGTLPAPNMAHGEWQSIGNIQSYLACPNNRCYKKKLNDNICPNCQSDYTSNDKGVVALIATAGLKLPDCKDLKTVKMFTDILRQTYSQLKPGLPFPTDVANLEDELFDELPKNCSFKINANNVLTHINLL